jgi:hypothetical protein
MVRGLILAVVALIALSVAHAADMDGVSMPDMRVVNGTQMRLNGIGLRTFSILGIRIYVAGLYLERRSDNTDAILHSPETKLLDIRFLRDVDAKDARKAWHESFEQNCKTPCYLDPYDEQQFLAVPARLVSVWTPPLLRLTLCLKRNHRHPYARAMTPHCYSRREASM